MTSLNVDNQDLSNFKDKVVLITGVSCLQRMEI